VCVQCVCYLGFHDRLITCVCGLCVLSLSSAIMSYGRNPFCERIFTTSVEEFQSYDSWNNIRLFDDGDDDDTW